MKHSNLFWGGLLVTLGALFILKNIGLVYFNWMSIFSLWPMILVLVGVTLLPIKNSIKTLLTLAILAATITLIFTKTNNWNRSYDLRFDRWDNWKSEIYIDDDEVERSEHNFHEPFDIKIKEATLSIDAVAGEFFISDECNHLMEFKQYGNVGPYIYSTHINDNYQTLNFEIKKKHFRPKGLSNDVEIKLNQNPIWSFNISTGAASIDLDLTNFKTKLIEIDGGASSVYLRLGDKYKKTKIYIDSGVSSIEIYVPEESACEIDTDTFLASKSFDDFDKIKRGLYQTPNFDSSENKIYISIDAAITSLEVVRY